MESRRASASCFRRARKAPSSLRLSPSETQTISASGVARRKASIRGNWVARSGACGCSAKARSLSSAARGSDSVASPGVSARPMIATGRPSRAAALTRDSASATRSDQSVAAPKPLSIRSSTGPRVGAVATGGFQTGPATAMMASAATAIRKASSHQGVCAGISRLAIKSAMILRGGKSMRRGRGGVTRRISQSAGSSASAVSASGAEKAMGSCVSIVGALLAALAAA